MGKLKKTILIFFAIVLVIALGFTVYYLAITSGVKIDENKFSTSKRSLTIYDYSGEIIENDNDGNNYTTINEVPNHVKDAFISIEDKRFYSHKGVDYRRLFGATAKNIKSFSFKEGASTITQQLIKNTHLTNEKTIKRKLLEIKLAKQLEKKYDKDLILETYLNHIYFGENCYGITSAARRYFDKEVKDLSINEGAILAAIIKAPSYYSPTVNEDKCKERRNVVLNEMYKQNRLSEQEYLVALGNDIELCSEQEKTIKNGYVKFAKTEFFENYKLSPYQEYDLKIKTFCDNRLQTALQNNLNEIDLDCDKTAIIIDKNSNVVAYYSTNNDQKRQLGSTIKPLACYAPAIEENLVDSFTKITDEKTDFNGYCPSNFNEKYYGKITVKESLAKSSNVCAVKLLNYLTVEKAKIYLEKLDISLSKKDVGLSIALGATEYGEKLINLANAFCCFLNEGVYSPTSTILNANLNYKAIYQKTKKEEKVFENATVSIVNDMLRYAVTDGTAKKLSFLDFPVYAKTGTVGNENGNTDAYVVSYNGEYVLAIRLNAKTDSYMNNAVTGGTIPTLTARNIWNEIYLDKIAPREIKLSSGVKEVLIDKISYENDEVVELADIISPDRYKLKVLVKEDRLPTKVSTRFSFPKIEMPKISANYNQIKIELCLTEYYNAEVYKEFNNQKNKVFDTINNSNYVFIDNEIYPNTKYKYYVLPYYLDANKKVYYGEELELETIKTPSSSLGESWWDDDL